MLVKKVDRLRRRRVDDTFGPARAGSDYGRVLCVAARIEDVTAASLAEKMGVDRTTVVRLVHANKMRLPLALKSAQAIGLPAEIPHALITATYQPGQFWTRVSALGKDATRPLDFAKPPMLKRIDVESLHQFALYAYHKDDQEKTGKSCQVCDGEPFGVVHYLIAALKTTGTVGDLADLISPICLAIMEAYTVLEKSRHKRLAANGFVPFRSIEEQGRLVARALSAFHKDGGATNRKLG